MSSYVPDSDLIAALLWNRPELDTEHSGTRAFVDALSSRAVREEPPSGDPLGIAAQAILSELQGDPESAIQGYNQLVDEENRLVRLLGLCLRCWSGAAPDSTFIRLARNEIEGLPDPVLRTRLTAKLIAAAFDHGWDELLPDLFEQALESAPPNSMLRAALWHEQRALIGTGTLSLTPHDPDPLTEYRWIRDVAADAAQTALRKQVEHRARSPWRLTFGFGAGALDAPYAAELQARWAGAVWLRAELQAQLAYHLFNGGASSPGDYALGVTLWAFGQGEQELPNLIDLAEPNFDHESADVIARHLTRSGALAGTFNSRLVRTAVECWDLLSQEAAVSLLDRFVPTVGDYPEQRNVAALWSLFSLRAPEAWEVRFARLDDENAAALLATTTPPVAEKLPLPAAERLYSLGSSSTQDIEAIVLRAALAKRLGREFHVDADAPAVAVVRAVTRAGYKLDRHVLERAVGALVDQVRSVVDDARQGRGGLGTYNPIDALSAGLVELGTLSTDAWDLLREAATDATIPRHVRYDAVKAISVCVSHGAVAADAAEALIDSIPEAGAESFWSEYSRSLMRSARTELAMACGRIDDHLPELLVQSRDVEARVRINAIDACALGRRRTEEDMLESILLSGLFDPGAEVVRHALGGFADQHPRRPAARAAVSRRLVELFDTAGRDIRAAIAELASSQDIPAAFGVSGARLLERARDDRSFIVRRAAGLDENRPRG